MSSKQKSALGGSILGKRPSLSTRPARHNHLAQPTASRSVNRHARPTQPASNRDRLLEGKEERVETNQSAADGGEQDDDEDEDDNDGVDEDSSSDSDNADIAIDINAKQHSNHSNQATAKYTKRHKPNATNTTHTTDSHSTSTHQPPPPSTDAELINVEFGLFDPLPDDDFTFRLLLKDYVPDHLTLPVRPSSSSSSSSGTVGVSGSGGQFALHELCALISHQVEVGTTIKADGTDEPLGIITALPLPPLLSAPLPLNQLHAYLSSHVPAAYKARLNALFSSSSHNVLMVQSRLLNTPTALVGPLHSALVEDIQWAAANQPTATQPANPWHVDRVLLLGRCVKAGGGVSGGRRGGGGGLDVWVRFEEEWYERESEWSCRWAVPYRSSGDGGESGGGEVEERREGQLAVLMCLTWDKVKAVVQHIQAMMKDA